MSKERKFFNDVYRYEGTALFLRLTLGRWVEVEHGRNHLITGQWCEPLTSVMEITNDNNDSQGIIVHYDEWEWISWSQESTESLDQTSMM